tara:strand:- start:506 stop:1162 length:657 start_codon:yes stop_codon:yes gene_type:complete
MAKDPAFLFYPGDWLGGTLGMSFEEKGAYIDLLVLQFNRGHMTSHMIGQTVGQIWMKIQNKFIQDENGLWYNARLDEEKFKRKAFVGSRKNNLKGNNQHTKNKEKNVGHVTSHMEDVNTNVFNNNKEQDIPNFEKVYEVVKRRGGTKEMAESFFNKHEAMNWTLNGSPIVKWEFLVNNFVASWLRNEEERKKRKTNSQPEFDPTKVKIVLKTNPNSAS